MLPTLTCPDMVTSVVLETAKVATSPGAFGTVAGVQFVAVFQSLLPGLRFQAAWSAAELHEEQQGRQKRGG